MLAVFILLQCGRLWVLPTLGSRWTTRVMVLPGAQRIRSGPYRYVNHPNYLVVAGEIAVTPMMERTAARGREIRGRAIARLVARGILLEPDDDGFLSLAPEVAHARSYPSTNGTPQEHVRLRVMRVLFSDDIPDPADIVIITLVDACAVWRKVLSVEELAKARERIAVVSRLDLIGQAVAALVRAVRPTADGARDGAGGPPIVRGLPLVTARSVWRDPRTFFLRQYRRLGPVFRIRTLGRNFVVMAGRDARSTGRPGRTPPSAPGCITAPGRGSRKRSCR